MTLTLDPRAIDLATLRQLWQGAPARLDDASMQRIAEAAASVLGLITLVAVDQQHTACLGHTEHVVPQLGVGRPGVWRHDRVQVAAPQARG